MSAQPGWYEAGVPGRERWWDGTQWTGYERAVPGPGAGTPRGSDAGTLRGSDAQMSDGSRRFGPTSVQGTPGVSGPEHRHGYSAPAVGVPGVAASAGYAGVTAVLPAMGWYGVPGTSDVRWWDGTAWTPYRIRDGKPRPDFFAVEPAGVGITLGIVFLAIGTMQLFLAVLSPSAGFVATPPFLLILGAIWLIGGVHTTNVRKLPSPQSAPVLDPSARPLPGEVEADGAGWYPVTGQVGRWWTGARWSWYLGMRHGVRPGHAGPRGYIVSMMMGWIVAGIGGLGLVAGILFMAIWAGLPGLSVLGGILIVIAVLFGGLGAFILLLTRSRRYAMLLPDTAPPVR